MKDEKRETWFSKITGVLFLMVWVGGWMGACLLFDIAFLRELSRRIVATTYPSVSARVVATDVIEEIAEGDKYQRPEVTYTFRVDGREFVNTLKGDRRRTLPETRAFLERHPVGSDLTIRYRPSDPTVTFTRVGIAGSDLMAAITAIPFHLIGLLVAYAGLKKRDPETKERGFQVLRRGQGKELRVRAPEGSGLGSAWPGTIGYFVLAYIAVWVIGKGEPEVWLVLTLFGFAGFMSWELFRKRKKKIRAGTFDITFDIENQTLTLPPTHGRARPITLRFDQVARVETDTEDHGGEGATLWIHVVSLYRRDDEGIERREIVLERSEEHQARSFAKWLRAKVLGKRPSVSGKPGKEKRKRPVEPTA